MTEVKQAGGRAKPGPRGSRKVSSDVEALRAEIEQLKAERARLKEMFESRHRMVTGSIRYRLGDAFVRATRTSRDFFLLPLRFASLAAEGYAKVRRRKGRPTPGRHVNASMGVPANRNLKTVLVQLKGPHRSALRDRVQACMERREDVSVEWVEDLRLDTKLGSHVGNPFAEFDLVISNREDSVQRLVQRGVPTVLIHDEGDEDARRRCMALHRAKAVVGVFEPAYLEDAIVLGLTTAVSRVLRTRARSLSSQDSLGQARPSREGDLDARGHSNK